MNKFLNLLILVSLTLITHLSFSQSATDTTTSVNLLEFKNAQANLDSLLNEWYVKNAIANDSIYRSSRGLEHYTKVADSIIIERLNKIPTSIQMSFNSDVRKWLDLYLKSGEYVMPTLLGLSQYYYPIFDEIFDANGIPLELKHLAVVESALNPQAVSPAGATGIWQFMFSTGKMYGLNINTLIDERKDPYTATLAAAKLFKELYRIYGDWMLAIAAYNCGPGNVTRALSRAGEGANYWDIYNFLPVETRGYIPAFVAMTYLMTYSNEHNFYPVKITLPMYSDTVIVTEKLHMKQVAEVLSLSLEELRDMNPQYKKDLIPGNTDKCYLRLPFQKANLFASLSDSIYHYKDSIYLNTVKVKTPTTVAATKYIASTSTSTYTEKTEKVEKEETPCDVGNLVGKTELIYTVKSGDTYGFIANWYNVSTTELKCWNNTTSNKLSIGDKIIVYVPTKKLTTYKTIDNLTFDQKQALTSDEIIKKSPTKLDETYIYYTIKSGDLISTIAAKYDGVTEADIKKLNAFTDSDVRRLQIGQVIKIKKK